MCPAFSDDDVGKTVVNASGEEVGMVTAVEHGTARVEPDPGITDTIKAALGWEGTSEHTYPLQEESIERITDDEIRLSGDFHEGTADETVESARTESHESSGVRDEPGTIDSDRDRTDEDSKVPDDPGRPGSRSESEFGNDTIESDNSRSREHGESFVPNRDVEGRQDERGARDRPDDRPMDPERGDERGRKSGLKDPDHDARTKRTRGSRGRDEESEAMDPDVGDGERIDEHDPNAGTTDRERHSGDRDADQDSDSS